MWHDRCGSLHLAYHDDEAQVLREFAADAPPRATTANCSRRPSSSPALGRREDRRAVAALWSPTETCVDPRQIIAELPGWLEREFGVRFEFGTAVTATSGRASRPAAGNSKAQRLFVCSGDDFQTLYPEAFAGAGLLRCKLQMMRSQAIRRAGAWAPCWPAG